MKKSFIAIGVASLLGLTSVAQAADFNWYGSIRAGLVRGDTGVLDLGATGSDGALADQGVYTRIGVDASTDLGNGQTAGAKIEIGVDGDLDIRHHHVWIGGGWGKLTLGQQDNPYRGAANWDQSYFLGGQIRSGVDGGSRLEGISYASNLAGPFSFDLTAVGDDRSGKKGVDQWIATAHYNFGVATVNLGYNKRNAVDAVPSKALESNNLNGEQTELATPGVAAAAAVTHAVISVNGSVGDFGYFLAREQIKSDGSDASITGLFLSYAVAASDSIYLEFEKGDSDGADDPKSTLLGYSHSFGDGVSFIAEHATIDKTNKVKVLNLVLKVDF